MKKTINRSTVIPNWYGVAYTENHGECIVCYPLFINVLACACKELILYIKHFGVHTNA